MKYLGLITAFIALLSLGYAQAQSPVLPGPGLPVASGGTITLDQFATASSTGTSGTTATLTTQTIANANEVLIVAITGQTSALATATTMVWDAAGANQSMTKMATSFLNGGTTNYVQLWCLINPATGNKIATATWTGGNQVSDMSSAAFIGSSQSTCAGAVVNANSVTGATGTISNPVTNVSGGMAIDAAACSNTLSANTQTAMTPVNNGGAVGIGMSRSAASGSVTFGWTSTGTYSDIAVSISP